MISKRKEPTNPSAALQREIEDEERGAGEVPISML